MEGTCSSIRIRSLWSHAGLSPMPRASFHFILSQTKKNRCHPLCTDGQPEVKATQMARSRREQIRPGGRKRETEAPGRGSVVKQTPWYLSFQGEQWSTKAYSPFFLHPALLSSQRVAPAEGTHLFSKAGPSPVWGLPSQPHRCTAHQDIHLFFFAAWFLQLM